MEYKIKPIRRYEEYAENEADCADNGMELLLNSIYENFLLEEEMEDEYGQSYFGDYNSYRYRKELLRQLPYSGAKEELANTRLFNGNSKFEVEISNLPQVIEKSDIRTLFTEIGDLFDGAGFHHFREEKNIANFLQRKALHITKEMAEESFREYVGFNEYQLLEYLAFAAINNNLYTAINKGLGSTSENSTAIESMMPETYHILVSLFRYFEDMAFFNWSYDPKGKNFKEVYNEVAQQRHSRSRIVNEEGKVTDKLVYKKLTSNCYLATCYNIEESLDKYIALFKPLQTPNMDAVLENRGYMLQLNEETGHIEKIFYVHLGLQKIMQTINIADFQEEYNKFYTVLVTLYASAMLYQVKSVIRRAVSLKIDIEQEYLSSLVKSFSSPYQVIVRRTEEVVKIFQNLNLEGSRFDFDSILAKTEHTFSEFSRVLTDNNSAMPFKARAKVYTSDLMKKRNDIKFNITDSEINKLNSINSLVKQIKFIMDIFRRKWLNADSLALLFSADYKRNYTVSEAEKIITKLYSTCDTFKDMKVPNAKLIMEEILKVLKRKSSWQLENLEKSFSKISSNVQCRDTIKWVFSLEAQDILTASVNDHGWSSCHASSYGNTPMALMSNGITFVIYEEEGDKLYYEIDNKTKRTYAHYKEERDLMPSGEVKRTLVLEGAYPRRYDEKVQRVLMNIIAEITGSKDIDVMYAEDAMFFGKDYDYDENDYEYEVPDDFIKYGYYDYFESNTQIGFQDGDYVEYLPTTITRYVPNLYDLYDEMSYFCDHRSNYDCLWR